MKQVTSHDTSCLTKPESAQPQGSLKPDFIALEVHVCDDDIPTTHIAVAIGCQLVHTPCKQRRDSLP
jgi:hypothetical protein